MNKTPIKEIYKIMYAYDEYVSAMDLNFLNSILIFDCTVTMD